MEPTTIPPGTRRSFLRVFFFSFFSPRLYRDVAEKWRGTGYGFIFLAVVFLAVPRAWIFQNWAAKALPRITAKIPDFQISRGRFQSPVAQPYWVNWGAGFTLVIDTTGKITQLDQIPGIEDLQNVVLITQTQWMERRVSLGLTRDRIMSLKDLPSVEMTRAKMKQWTTAFVRRSAGLAYLFIILVWFPFEAAALLIYTWMTLLFSKIIKRRLRYGSALRLTAISHIPNLTFSALIPLAVSGDFPISGFVLISLAYLFFAVLCLPKQ
ncbi:MAG: DUF1189 family protein [bacterium]